MLMGELTREGTLFEHLEGENFEQIRATLTSFHPSEIAHLLESLPGKSRELLRRLVDPEIEGDVLSDVQDAVRAGLPEQMQPQEVAEVTRGLGSDDVADLLTNRHKTSCRLVGDKFAHGFSRRLGYWAL